MMKSKLTRLLFMTAFVELVAPSCRRRRQGAKAHGRNPALICSLNGWPTAVHLKGPATMAVVGGKLRVCRLMCRFLGRRHDDVIHGLWRPASEKRQGTKSRK